MQQLRVSKHYACWGLAANLEAIWASTVSWFRTALLIEQDLGWQLVVRLQLVVALARRRAFRGRKGWDKEVGRLMQPSLRPPNLIQ